MNPERRIGSRVETPDLRVVWTVPRPERSLLRWRRKEGTTVEARVLNVSATGAALLVYDEAPLAVGALVRIDCDGHSGLAIIRRCQPLGAGEVIVEYGVRFEDPSPEFIDALFANTSAPSSTELVELWNRAH